MCNKLAKLVLCIFILSFFIQYNVFAKEEDKKNNDNEVNPVQDAIEKDIEKMKRLLMQERSAPSDPIVSNVEINLLNNPSIGEVSAPLVMVEFSDYSCHYCARHVKETNPDIFKKYIKTGILRYVVVDNPLPNHSVAVRAAEAAHCANEQNKFWEMHDEMMFNQESLNDLTLIASSIELNMEKLKSCLAAKRNTNKVMSNISMALELKIPSVPGFIIASSQPDNPQKVKGISYIRGAKSFSHFQQEIEKALTSLGK